MNTKTFCKLFDFLPKSRIKAKQGKSLGKFPFYTSSNQLSKFIDEYIYSGKSLIFGTGGNPSIHYQPKKFATSTDCVVAQPKKDSRIDPQYCYLFIANNMHILEAGFKGAGLKHISKEYISKIKIPLPEKYEDQIRIATLLSRAEALIAKRKESIRLLDELLQSTFLEMFGDPVRNEKGWKQYKLKEISTRFSDGPFGSNLKTEHYSNSGIRVIRLQNIGVNQFLDKDKVFVHENHYNKVLKKYTCNPNDIVIATMGTPNIRACTIPDYIEKSINKADCVLCRPDKNIVNNKYLVSLMNLPSFLSLAANLFHGQTRTRVSMGQLSKLSVPIAPIKLQNKFAQIVEKVESIKSKYETSLTELENLYGSLSQRAFRGELDLSRIPVVTAIKPETAELKLENYAPKVEITKRFSKKELIKFIKSKSGQSFNFDEMWNRLDASSFEEQPQYDDVKKMIFDMLEGEEPLLSQSFAKQRKEIVLRENI